jgi:hypothetical protein
LEGHLIDAGVPGETTSGDLSEIDGQLERAQRHAETHSGKVLIELLRDNNAQIAQRFLERCEAFQLQCGEVLQVLVGSPDASCIELISSAAQICEQLNLNTIDLDILAEELEDRRKFIATSRSISTVLAPLVTSRPQSTGWSLSDIAKAYALLNETGRDALLSRNACTGERDAPHHLQELCGEGKKLRAQKAELARRVSFTTEVSVEALSESVSTIRTAGMFRLFSRRYRNAKRQFLSIARVAKFDKQEAVNTLETLISFRKRESEFNHHPYVRAAFGIHFRGIETEFERFERLARFYTRIESQFSSPDKQSLRVFLREADVTELDLVPAIRPNAVAITYDSVRQRIEAAEAQVRIREQAIAALEPYVHIFVDPKSVKPDDLRPLMSKTRALLDEKRDLDECDEARLILDEMFKGSQTSGSNLGDVVRWAVAAQRLGKLLASILAADKTARARNQIGEVLRAEQNAIEILERLSAIAKSAPSILRMAAAPGGTLHRGLIARQPIRRVFSAMPSLPLCWRKFDLKGCFRSLMNS